MSSCGLSSLDEVMAKGMEPYAFLGFIEIQFDELAMPALEKHVWKGGNVTESAVDGRSTIMIHLMMCTRALVSVRVVWTMVMSSQFCQDIVEKFEEREEPLKLK
jgi:hypothetical protein